MDYDCIVEFDGACKGNPGIGGAGAVIRDSRENEISRVHEYLGITTNNAAEYEGLILGLETAIQMGYTKILAKGDSKLVCKQLDGSWRVRSKNLYKFYNRAYDLMMSLDKFKIIHIPREYNTEADAEANKGIPH